MSESFQLGATRKKNTKVDPFLLLVSAAVLAACLWKFGPQRAGNWEAAFNQIAKRTGAPTLFYPAWHRDVLDKVSGAPPILLDRAAHLPLAGLGTVVFASDIASPEEIVQNQIRVMEWRDYAGKPTAVLNVATWSLRTHLQQSRVRSEQPPGQPACTCDSNTCDCPGDTPMALSPPASTSGVSPACLQLRTRANTGHSAAVTVALPPSDEAGRVSIYARAMGSGVAQALPLSYAVWAGDQVLQHQDVSLGQTWHVSTLVLPSGHEPVEIEFFGDGACVDVEFGEP